MACFGYAENGSAHTMPTKTKTVKSRDREGYRKRVKEKVVIFAIAISHIPNLHKSHTKSCIRFKCKCIIITRGAPNRNRTE